MGHWKKLIFRAGEHNLKRPVVNKVMLFDCLSKNLMLKLLVRQFLGNVEYVKCNWHLVGFYTSCSMIVLK